MQAKKSRIIYKPEIEDDTDVTNFSLEFTRQEPVDVPCDAPANADRLFKGYSYVNPYILQKMREAQGVARSDSEMLDYKCRPLRNQHIIGRVMEQSTTSRCAFYSHYVLIPYKILGRGASSICVLAQGMTGNNKYAVKIVDKTYYTPHEIEALRELNGHRGVVSFIEHFIDDEFVFMVFEYLAGGELLERIKTHTRFTESIAKKYFRQIVEATAYIHSKNYVHRDLKPENILLVNKSNADLKLIDFGFARQQAEQEHGSVAFTLNYAAPEALTGEAADMPRDLWSLGVILYVMLCGTTPFFQEEWNNNNHSEKLDKVLNNIKAGEINEELEVYRVLSDNVKDLIRGLLSVDPKLRYTMNDVKDHPWLKGARTVRNEIDINSKRGSIDLESVEQGIKLMFKAMNEIQTNVPLRRSSSVVTEIFPIDGSSETSGVVTSNPNESEEEKMEAIVVDHENEGDIEEDLQQVQDNSKEGQDGGVSDTTVEFERTENGELEEEEAVGLMEPKEAEEETNQTEEMTHEIENDTMGLEEDQKMQGKIENLEENQKKIQEEREDEMEDEICEKVQEKPIIQEKREKIKEKSRKSRAGKKKLLQEQKDQDELKMEPLVEMKIPEKPKISTIPEVYTRKFSESSDSLDFLGFSRSETILGNSNTVFPSYFLGFSPSALENFPRKVTTENLLMKKLNIAPQIATDYKSLPPCPRSRLRKRREEIDYCEDNKYEMLKNMRAKKPKSMEKSIQKEPPKPRGRRSRKPEVEVLLPTVQSQPKMPVMKVQRSRRSMKPPGEKKTRSRRSKVLPVEPVPSVTPAKIDPVLLDESNIYLSIADKVKLRQSRNIIVNTGSVVVKPRGRPRKVPAISVKTEPIIQQLSVIDVPLSATQNQKAMERQRGRKKQEPKVVVKQEMTHEKPPSKRGRKRKGEPEDVFTSNTTRLRVRKIDKIEIEI